MRQLDLTIHALPRDTPMDTLEAVQILREVILDEKPAATRSQRMAKTRPAKAFLTTKAGDPLWSKVSRRVTLSLSTGVVVEDLQVNNSTPKNKEAVASSAACWNGEHMLNIILR